MLVKFNNFTRSVRYVFQILLMVLLKIIVHPFTRVDTKSVKQEYLHNQGYLIVANHSGAFDPFIICGGLPIRTILKILPVAFMTHNAFYDSPLRPLLWLSGCFPARDPYGRHKIFGVEGSLRLLEQGYSICIFPEGTRRRSVYRIPAKSGVIKIHKGRPSTPFILAHINYHPGLKAWLTFRRRTVSYKLVDSAHFSNPEIIMDEIFRL